MVLCPEVTVVWSEAVEEVEAVSDELLVVEGRGVPPSVLVLEFPLVEEVVEVMLSPFVWEVEVEEVILL